MSAPCAGVKRYSLRYRPRKSNSRKNGQIDLVNACNLYLCPPPALAKQELSVPEVIRSEQPWRCDARFCQASETVDACEVESDGTLFHIYL